MKWNLGVNTAHDYCYYHTLTLWKDADPTFPFIDSHNKTYNVRDDSEWERTLKPRLHERLRNSKNIILFLSSITSNSRALREEIDYGINTLGLPVIVIYPEYNENTDIVGSNGIKSYIRNLWNKLPVFRDNMDKVPTMHIPMKKSLIRSALNDPDFMILTKTTPSSYYYKL
jgi:hypothetical protein